MEAQGNAEEHACVVYTRETGDIIQIHKVIVLPGADPATDDDVAQEALELARRHEHVTGDVAVRHLTPSELALVEAGAQIEPTSGELV